MNAAALTLSRRRFDAVIFDLDGVITQTAKVHAAAWKAMFDDFLQRRAAARGEPFRPFDIDTDYRRYVDGKPRYDGVQSFLASRGIALPYGDPADPPAQDTVCGLGNRKNRMFLEVLEKEGVAAYDSTIALIRQLRAHGFRTAMVTASKSGAAILARAGISDLFDAKVDGVDAAELGLRGKPAPDPFLEAARRLDVEPARAVVVEDAIAGVQSGHAGGFGCVIGVNRGDYAAALREGGADVVVRDLAELGVAAQ